jgi:hypothetical protein
MRVARVAVTAGLLVAAAGGVGAIRAATRLDRLHVRTDAAWAALDAALCRRAAAIKGLGGGLALHRAVDAALQVGSASVRRPGSAVREEIENELSQLLAVVDRQGVEPADVDRLADSEQRVLIARRVYNDAVRDTLALRSHRMVRWLRLAGTAAAPRYFDIAEPASPSYGLALDGAGA